MAGREAGRKVRQMMKVSVEVRKGSVHFWVAVQAESIRRAMSLVRAKYQDAEIRVKFPIEPESFFIEGPAARAALVESDHPKEMSV